MPATFTRELLSREVRDKNGDVLGHVADLIFDTRTGSVTFVLIRIHSDLRLVCASEHCSSRWRANLWRYRAFLDWEIGLVQLLGKE